MLVCTAAAAAAVAMLPAQLQLWPQALTVRQLQVALDCSAPAAAVAAAAELLRLLLPCLHQARVQEQVLGCLL
jgi:hypothetical protein